MKKLWIATCLFLFMQGNCDAPCCTSEICASPSVETKVGYFFFTDSTMRKIYNPGGIDVQISGFYPLKNWGERTNLGLYGSIEYLYCSGKSLHYHQKTFLWELPLSVGLRPMIRITPRIHYYFALGPRYFHIQQRNSSSFVNRHNVHNTIGMFVNTGFNFIPTAHFLIDLFGEYSYREISFHSSKPNVYTKSTQISGFTFGAGLGYQF